MRYGRSVFRRCGLVVLVAMALGLALPQPSNAKIKLPDKKEDRDRLVKEFGKLCMDYPLSGAMMDGSWWLAKGDRIQLETYTYEYDADADKFVLVSTGPAPSNQTPKGCKLVCDSIDKFAFESAGPGSTGTITVAVTDTPIAGTRRHDPAGASDPNRGSDSTIEIGRCLTDETVQAYDDEDAEGKPRLIPAPVHKILGHELIHALHNANGTRNAADPEGQTIDSANPGGHGITENDLRDENHLPPRHGHCIKVNPK